MMKKLKNDKDLCLAMDNGYLCTFEANHLNAHIAFSGPIEIAHVWHNIEWERSIGLIK